MKSSDTSFAIGIPTLNRWDLLKPSLEKYLVDFPNTDIYVWDNSAMAFHALPKIHFISCGPNIGVAASWNKLCALAYLPPPSFKSKPCTHALILNDDIYLGKTELQIKELIASSTGKLLTCIKDFSAFVLPRSTYEMLGSFDENFFCYYEDADYIYRLKLKGFAPIRMSALSPTEYRDNSTGEKEPLVAKWALQSKQYYLKKWGGMPGQEKFLSPFNEKLKK